MTERAADPADAAAALLRNDQGRLMAALVRYTGDFQLAEDSLQDALESAIVHWRRQGIPAEPIGWLLRTAQRKAIDRLRRTKNFSNKAAQYQYLLTLDQQAATDGLEDEAIPDERLRLIFTCCHPALAPKVQIALALRSLCGLTTEEIAHAFFVSPSTMAQRLVRARQKIQKAGIPYAVPDAEQWPERRDAVLAAIYLVFNEGYAASSGAQALRVDLCNEAIRLAQLLQRLQPEEPEAQGLLALLLLIHARTAARLNADNELVPLSEQNRGRWDTAAIATGLQHIEQALRRGRPGPYQIQAAINALHAEATSHTETDWPQIVLLYRELQTLQENPVFALNEAVALSHAAGPECGHARLQTLRAALTGYRSFHAAEADMLRRTGDHTAARAAYERAIAVPGNDTDTRFLRQRLEQLSAH